MQHRDEHIWRGFDWLTDFGVREVELRGLNPCVPGEFTLDDALYVNSGTPNVVYRGAGEATLPLVAGRWYMIPSSLTQRYPRLRQETAPVARAPRLIST